MTRLDLDQVNTGSRTLQETGSFQARYNMTTAEAERNQRKLRASVFAAGDEINDKRDALIEKLERQMRQTVNTEHLYLFFGRWFEFSVSVIRHRNESVVS